MWSEPSLFNSYTVKKLDVVLLKTEKSIAVGFILASEGKWHLHFKIKL